MEYTFVSPVPDIHMQPKCRTNDKKISQLKRCRILLMSQALVFVQETSKLSKVFFSLFFFRGNYICMNLRFVLFARLKILPLSFLRLQYLGTVQNGRHKSTSLIIFSHLVKLHAHVQHKTCIDHTPERQ